MEASLRKLGLTVVLVLMVGCPPVEGEVLTGPCLPDAGLGPLKVLFAVENSGRMCVLDPPGDGPQTNAFCGQISLGFGLAVSRDEPGRISAVERFMAAAPANVQGGVLAWDSAVLQEAAPFSMGPLLSQLKTEVGHGNDLQVALDAVEATLRADMEATAESERAVTRYVVVLLSSGVPYPRCAADDVGPAFASPTQPEGVWPDEPVPARAFPAPDCLDWDDGVNVWCTPQTTPPDAGITRQSICQKPASSGEPWYEGRSHNQNDDLTAAVDRIVALRDTWGVADVRVDTVLVHDAENVSACGILCKELFNPYPQDSLRPAARWLLERLAEHGRGRFFDPGAVSQLDVAPLVWGCRL